MTLLADYDGDACGVHRTMGVAATAVPWRVPTAPMAHDTPEVSGWLQTDDDLWDLDTWPPAHQTDWSLARVALLSELRHTDAGWNGGIVAVSWRIEAGQYTPPSEAITRRSAWRGLFGQSGGAVDCLAPWWDPIWEVGEWTRHMAWGSGAKLVPAGVPDGLVAGVRTVLGEVMTPQARAVLAPRGAPCDALVLAVALDHYGDPERRNYALTVVLGVHCVAEDPL